MVIMGKIASTILLLFVSAIAGAQADQSLVARGNELYKKQQFEQATEQFRKAADLNTKNAKAHFNLGDALYKSGKTEESQKAFTDAANNSKDETAKSKAFYNKGVAL